MSDGNMSITVPVGAMEPPKEWFSASVGSVCTLVNGRGFKPHEWKESGLPIIRIQNLNGSDEFNYYQGAYNPKIFIEYGQLLFAWSGSRGTSFGPHVWRGGDALLNYHTWKIVINDGINHAYLYYSLKRLTAEIEADAHGASALVHTQKGEMEKYSILVPPLQEQEAIASALSNMDALLSGLDQLIAKKRDIKQATMQQLLTGQTRLPGFSGEWEVKRLGELCRITTGKKDVNEGNPNGQFPFFTCARNPTFSDDYSFDCEAILIAGNGEVGNLNYYSGKFEAYQRTYVLMNFSLSASYIWHQLSAHLADALGIGKIGSSIPYIKKGDLLGFELKHPTSVEEQAAIVNALSDMDDELATLETRRNKCMTLKQGMMQELLTGRIRLLENT